MQTLRDLDQLESLRSIWESWPGTRDSDLDYFSAVVRSRGNRCRPHVIVLTRNASPDAILIGLRERRKMPFRLGYFTICQPEVNVLEFVAGGLRGNATVETCAVLIREVIRSLDEGDAELALWDELDVGSPLYDCALRLPRFAQRDHSRCVYDYWWLQNPPKGLDAFLMGLRNSQRSKLRRKYRKVLNRFAGRVRVCCVRSLTGLESAIGDIEGIARKAEYSWPFGRTFSDTPQIRQRMVVAAEKGWLRIYLLYLEERPAAFWVGTLYRRCLQADYVGYDPVWGEYSPGTFLVLDVIERCRDEDIEIADFGYGNTQLKESFGDVRRLQARLQIYAPTLRGLQLNLLSTAAHRATAGAKNVLRRIHRLDWAKRFLGRRLTHR